VVRLLFQSMEDKIGYSGINTGQHSAAQAETDHTDHLEEV